MKDLYIHIGTHKTGSTYLQKTLKENAKSLNQEGILILNLDDFIDKNFSNRFNNREIIVKDLNNLLKEGLQSIGNKVIISSESFSGNLFKLYADRKWMFKIIKQAIPEGYRTHFIVFFRRQDDFIQSAYAQAINENQNENVKQALLKVKYDKGLDWYSFIKELQEIIPNAEYNVFPYDKKLLITKPIHVLVGEILSSNCLRKINNVKSSNVGMTKEGVELYESIIKGKENKFDFKTEQHLRFIIQEKANKGVFKEYEYLTPDQKNHLLDLYDTSNSKLADLFWNNKFEMDNFSSPSISNSNQVSSDEIKDKVIESLLLDVQKYSKNIRRNSSKMKKSFLVKLAHKLHRHTGL